MREIRVGLLGLGVVGNQVAHVLLERSDSLSRQVGATVTLQRILVRDASKERSPSLARDSIFGIRDSILGIRPL